MYQTDFWPHQVKKDAAPEPALEQEISAYSCQLDVA
jgi:hypothetical protein